MKRYLSNKEVPLYAERRLAVNGARGSVFRQESINIGTVLNSLKTTSVKFKFPTVMSGYQPSINPVSALYENVQEILLNNNHNHASTWILSLFDNLEWKMALIAAIKKDRITMTEVYKSEYLSTYDRELLGFTIEKFRHYHIVFSTI